jgi:predicted RNA-binding Zn ribbon-like protein
VLLFYDTTKNHARHWCSMSLCGNRHKVAAHYRRRRSPRT